MGVLGHWTDLGEPEMFAPNSWYAGLPGLELHDQAANHNLYNLQWAESIWLGYARNDVAQRPAMLSRSGTSGIQRYGAALWSGDIAANFASLAAHMNAQMHLSLSGVDYFGSDVGGFHRGGISEAELDELYTVWLANSALLDVPVRPHTENLCNCKETAPDRVGDVASNLANVRLRYALSPYLYSLAHMAYREGAPVVPPLLFYFQEDANTRTLGDHKLLGENLLVRTVTEPGITAVPVYLPAGQWVDFYSGAWLDSAGGWLDAVPVVADGLFRLPLFLRAGAIVPHMAVDAQTMNLAGLRRDGSTRDELIVQVVPAPEATTFTLYEDDGRSTAYQEGAVRTTELAQQWTEATIIGDGGRGQRQLRRRHRGAGQRAAAGIAGRDGICRAAQWRDFTRPGNPGGMGRGRKRVVSGRNGRLRQIGAPAGGRGKGIHGAAGRSCGCRNSRWGNGRACCHPFP